MTQNSIDKKYIRRCFTLAKKGYGKVSPNPLVGSVIVKDGKVISEGWHKKFGGPHAEANAIANAKSSLKGATLYCNLEPCCHTNKKTPPCVPAIISAGIKRVVVSNLDPNPDVAGKGMKQLKDAGISVTSGVREEEGNEINKFFFKHIRTGLPYVTVKIAQTLDGKISSGKGKQTWITGEESQKYVHKLRSIYDAVLIGSNTVKIDDPELNVRTVRGRDPKKIIIDGKLSSPLKRKIFTGADLSDVFLFTSKESSKKKKEILKSKNCKVFELSPDKNGKLQLKRILKILGKENISSILVEGGNKIFSNFIKNDLFEEILILQASVIFGTGLDSFNVNSRKDLEFIAEQKVGSDRLIKLRKRL